MGRGCIFALGMVIIVFVLGVEAYMIGLTQTAIWGSDSISPPWLAFFVLFPLIGGGLGFLCLKLATMEDD